VMFVNHESPESGENDDGLPTHSHINDFEVNMIMETLKYLLQQGYQPEQFGACLYMCIYIYNYIYMYMYMCVYATNAIPCALDVSGSNEETILHDAACMIYSLVIDHKHIIPAHHLQWC
jgi:hypothetical protein